MSLLKTIINKVRSTSDMQNRNDKKYASPPPERDEEIITHTPKKKIYKYAHVKAKVDTSPPRLNFSEAYKKLAQWSLDFETIKKENMYLLMLINKAHLYGGKVDSRWTREPVCSKMYYKRRVNFLKRIHRDNLILYHHITTRGPRIASTASLTHDWFRNRRDIVEKALHKFVLFPPIPQEDIEDHAFATPPGVERPRVYMTLGIRDCAVLGELCMELFTDVCPATCQLFTDLLDGDTLGHGYVGTCFFTKVPNLYWSGGDVIHNNGFGCYAQRGRKEPIGAENYHFPHSMPGLLSMRVTCDDEVCGIFHITFKALPQLDLHNVVFGRIIRPSFTYETVSVLGKMLSSQPLVEVRSTRRKCDGRWVTGLPNTRIKTQRSARQMLMRRR